MQEDYKRSKSVPRGLKSVPRGLQSLPKVTPEGSEETKIWFRTSKTWSPQLQERPKIAQGAKTKVEPYKTIGKWWKTAKTAENIEYWRQNFQVVYVVVRVTKVKQMIEPRNWFNLQLMKFKCTISAVKHWLWTQAALTLHLNWSNLTKDWTSNCFSLSSQSVQWSTDLGLKLHWSCT